MNEHSSTLEAVYYASPIFSGRDTMTLLGLVFDRIHFPDVHLPFDGYDLADVEAEAKRIEQVGYMDHNVSILLGSLRTLKHLPHLREFCVFSDGTKKQVRPVETAALIKALENEVFGPPSEGHFPVHQLNFSKPLPGGNASLDYPGPFQYPAAALIYAARHGIPVVNDNAHLPVPASAGASPKNNEKLLASILAMECIDLTLPQLRPLSPEEVVAARKELDQYLQPFRKAILLMTQKLNSAISEDSTSAEIVKSASFLAKTEVLPTLAELSNELNKPAKGWAARGFEVVRQAPALVAAYYAVTTEQFVAAALAVAGGLLVDLREKSRTREAARSGLYYLLKLQQRNIKPRVAPLKKKVPTRRGSGAA